MWVPSSLYLASSHPTLPIHLLAFPSRACGKSVTISAMASCWCVLWWAEYSSYQYGLHQCWISHSGLADCPPAAYSNIVSRIVIFEAEPRLRILQAAEYSQREKWGEKRKKLSVLLLLRQKRLIFFLWKWAFWTAERNRWRLHLVTVARSYRNSRAEKRWREKPDQGQNRAWKVPWSLIRVFLLFPPSLFSPIHPHAYTWESRQLMCCLWWQREAYINSQKTMMKEQGRDVEGWEKKKENAWKIIRKNGNSWQTLGMQWR